MLYGNPSAIARDFSPHTTVLRRDFLPNMQFECCMILQGTLGNNFDIFAASGESTAWVLLWKTRSRPIGVRVCPVVQFNFFSTIFDPGTWTMVVLWREILGRQPQPITPENAGGDDTRYPSPSNFLDHPGVASAPTGPPELPRPPDPSLAGDRESGT